MAAPPVPAAAPPDPAGNSRLLIPRAQEDMEQGGQREQGGGEQLPDYEDFGENIEQRVADINYTEKGNDKKILFAMAIGLTDKHAAPYLSWKEVDAHGAIAMPDAFNDARVSQIKPSNTYLIDEQKPAHREGRGGCVRQHTGPHEGPLRLSS